MKVRLLLLLGSLALNVALMAAFVLRPNLAPPGLRDFFQRNATPTETEAAMRGRIRDAVESRAAAQKTQTERAAASRAQLWTTLNSDDLPTLIARLRAAGFSRSVVLAIVNARLDARFADRMKALTGDVATLPYWKPDPMNSPNNSKYWEEYSQIYRERSKMLRELLGADSAAWAGADPTTAQRREFGGISKEKIELIQRINDDYAEMTSQIRAAMQGINLPEDREKLALLEREKRADLAAFLTPAELEDYEMRSSQATMRLRNTLTLLDATEDEFRTIFRITQPYNELINPSGPMSFSNDYMEQRREAQKKIADQIQAALGPARFAEYARASNSEFQQLHRSAQRENIPTETVVRAFSLRDSLSAESVRIVDDGSLTADQKRSALQALAQKGRAQIIGTLGATVGEAYAQTNRWLSAFERGSGVTFTADGGVSYRSIPPPPRPPAP